MDLRSLRLSAIAAASLSLIAVAGGCSKNTGSAPGSAGASQKVQAASGAVAAKLVSEGKGTEAAAEYARIGELLLLPEGVTYADKMFDKALELDATNAKANFYSAITKPLMKWQGFITRFGQIAEPKDAERLLKLRQEIEKLNLPELTKFAMILPPGKAPFASYHEVQRFMKDELLPEVVNSVAKLDRLKSRNDVELNINLARLGFEKTKATYSYSCNQSSYSYTEPYGGGTDSNGNPIPKQIEYRYWDCSYTADVQLADIMKSERVLLDASDVTIARGAMMAWADSIRLSSAYSFEGLQEAMSNLKRLQTRRWEADRELTTRDIIQELARHSDLFTIERDQELVQLARSEQQVLTDALALGELQADLCQNEDRHSGENLIKSFCLYAKDLSNIKFALDLLAGPKMVKIGYDVDGEEVFVKANVPALINTPVADFKSLFPIRFDKRGNPIHWQDLTFGGLFPDGDLVEKLEHVVVGRPMHREFHLPRLHIH